MDGYEKNYNGLVPFLAEVDLVESAQRLGLAYTELGVKVHFLGRDYLVDKQGVTSLDGQKSPANARSIIVHYMLSKSHGDPGSDFLTLSQLPGVMRSRKEPGRDILNKPLLDTLGDAYGDFERAALKLGGVELENKSGTHRWLFKIFPKIHMQLVFMERDEEFPPEIRIMFDSGALSHMGFECLAFLNGSLSLALVENAQP